MSRAKGSVVRKENPVLGDRIEAALAILSGTPISFSYQGADLRYVWFENAPDDWDVDGATGGTDANLFPAASAAEIVTAKRNVLESGSPRKYELALEQDRPTAFRPSRGGCRPLSSSDSPSSCSGSSCSGTRCWSGRTH